MRNLVLAILLFNSYVYTYAATIKLGLLTDTHTGDTADTKTRFYSQVPDKVAAAVSQFVSSDVDLIIHCGDTMDKPSDTDELASMVEQINNNAGSIPVLWCIGNHDCYTATFDKDDWMTAVGQAFTYDYIDLDNLRIFAIDCGYSVNGASWPTEYNYKNAYISESELSQLDSDLTVADTAGKYSIICSHIRLGDFGNYLDVKNYRKLWDVLMKHKVIATFAGHAHAAKHSNCWVTNSDGNQIKFFGLEAVVDGNGVNAYSVASINDATGAITITGYGNAYGHKETTWTNGDADGDYSNTDNWSNGLPANGDIVIFDSTSNTAASANLYQHDKYLMELRVSSGYTQAMGGGSYVYWKATAVNMYGGFNTTRLHPTCDVLNCYGQAGSSKTIYLHGTGVIGYLNLFMPDTTWYVLSQGKVTNYVVTGGKVCQVRASSGACGDILINGSNAEVELCAQTTTPLVVGVVTIVSGLLDVANLVSTADLLTIDKLKIKGGNIDLADGTVTLTNGIELYGSPATFTHLNSQCWPVKTMGVGTCSLTQTVSSYSGTFITSGGLVAGWLIADLNGDYLVNFKDFSIFANQWLKCSDPCDPNCQPSP